MTTDNTNTVNESTVVDAAYLQKMQQTRAEMDAKVAHEHLFHSRRGAVVVNSNFGVQDAVSLYDNDPRRGDDGKSMVHALDGLIASGTVEVLAVASYPTDGPDAGYTKVAVVRGGLASVTEALRPFVSKWLWRHREPRVLSEGRVEKLAAEMRAGESPTTT